MEATIYNKEGKEVSKITLPEEIFGLKWNSDLVHQVIVSMQGNKRQSIADTKNRGEVSGGGKKPWRQKGTGRARHGSIRSPLWKGGGVTFGPRAEKIFERKINRKAKIKALWTILAKKYRDGEVIFVEDLGISKPKTKDATSILGSFAKVKGLEKINYKKGKRVLVATGAYNPSAVKSFRNLGASMVEEVRNLNPLSVMTYKYLIIESPKESVAMLSRQMGNKKDK